jgi:ABC-type multidrug transport system fused ATPase/permease subunit
VSRLNGDTAVIQDSLSTNVSMFIRSSFTITATMVICFILSWKLALTFLAGMIPIAAFSIKYAGFMREIAKKISSQKALMSTIADESLSNIRTVKAFANEEEEI